MEENELCFRSVSTSRNAKNGKTSKTLLPLFSYRVALDLGERERRVVDLAADVPDPRHVREHLDSAPGAVLPLLPDDGEELLGDGAGGDAPDCLPRRGAAAAGHGADAVPVDRESSFVGRREKRKKMSSSFVVFGGRERKEKKMKKRKKTRKRST